MKRLMFLLCTISACLYSSCNPETARRRRMEAADALERSVCRAVTPDGQATNQFCDIAAAAASQLAANLVLHPMAEEPNPNIHIPIEFLLPSNPFEADGILHNDAIDLIVKEKLSGVDVLDKLMNRDRQTIDKFLKLSPELKDDNMRADAVDAIVALEVPTWLQDKSIKIATAKDYKEAITYLDMPEDEKALVTEVYGKCNDYYIDEADFGQVAGYLNSKIESLLNKGKDMTMEDRNLAGMFTILKHSYYYWHGTNK